MHVAWLFPGQGSQAVGMGKDLFDASPVAHDIFALADAALGEPISKIILEGPEDALTLTANAQPALVTVSIAILADMLETYTNLPKPRFVAGHSLGEYSALVAAGALSFEDAVRIVRARGRAMQEATPPGEGAMAAIVGLDTTELEEMCSSVAQDKDTEGNPYGVVSCANFNAPGQIVIAGTARAVARVSLLASEAKARAIPLKVSAPFHCALMAPAAVAVKKELEKIDIKPLAFPVIANVDARPNSDPLHVKELLVRQVDSAVRWEQAIRLMHAEGVTHAVEIGPGKVLAGLCKRIAKDIKVFSVGDVEGVNGLREFLDIPQRSTRRGRVYV